MISRRLLLGGGAVSAATAYSYPAWAADKSGPPTVREFFDDPTAVDAGVSPDGKTVAVLRQTVERVARDRNAQVFEIEGQRVQERRQKPDKYTATIELRSTSDVDTVRIIKLGDLRTEKIAWLNNDLMMIWVVWQSSEVRLARRLAVLSRDGKSLRYLIQKNKEVSKFNPDHGNVIDLLPNDPKHIMIALGDVQTQVEDSGQAGTTLYKLNIYDDTLTAVDRGVTGTIEWLLQDGEPLVRRDMLANQKAVDVMARSPGQKGWKRIAQQPIFLGTPHEFEIMGVTKEAGLIRVASYTEGNDSKALYEFDVRNNSWGKRLSTRNADVNSVLDDGAGGYLGCTYVDDTVSYESPNAAFAEDMKVLGEAFPNCSVTIANMTPDAQHLVVRVSGPQSPGMFVYFNRAAGAVALLDQQQPWLKEDRLVPTETIRVKTKDGQTLTAYVTGKSGKRPMVIVPHGGPEARDQLQFDAFNQVLAAQGWVVVQPNFRGSSGYGKAFADAGRRKWDTLMMEDIEACADAVIASGRGDASRTAIFGWSFGGYAALMCGVRRPDAYRAVVSVAGPSDLPRILRQERAAGVDSVSYKYWVKTIGDPETDGAALKQASPSERAGEINAPVLLIHGRLDKVVDSEQSRSMAGPLRMRNKSVELFEIPGMDHSPYDREQMVEIFEKIVGFLKPKLA